MPDVVLTWTLRPQPEAEPSKSIAACHHSMAPALHSHEEAPRLHFAPHFGLHLQVLERAKALGYEGAAAQELLQAHGMRNTFCQVMTML